MFFVIDDKMPLDSIDLSVIFILHRLIDDDFPAVLGFVLGNFLPPIFAIHDIPNARVEIIDDEISTFAQVIPDCLECME